MPYQEREGDLLAGPWIPPGLEFSSERAPSYDPYAELPFPLCCRQ